MARLVASWSKDPSTQVGAVIARPDKTVASVGFNGLPRTVADTVERLHNKELKYPLIIHAEINAIFNAHQSVRGCALYVWPLPPCYEECVPKIIQAGISLVAFPDQEANAESKWLESARKGFLILEEAGVQMREVELPAE